MRILHISSARSLGGGERHLAGLVSALVARGHEVHVVLSPQSPLAEELSALPAAHILRVPLRNALDLKSALELARIVRERQIELVHAHVARDYPLAALAVRRVRGARLVITRHVLFPLSRLHAVTLLHAARVIAVSEAVAHRLNAQRIVPACKLTVVPNGVDFSRFDDAAREEQRASFRRSLGLRPESLLVGSVGELKREKGHDDFLRAAASISRAAPDAEFVIAGADTSKSGEHLSALVKLAQQSGIGERVHFTGWLGDIAPMLAALDLFVSASHTESFGLAIAEAMGSGLAVVSTATDGAREIITEGTGLLVPVGDAEAIAQAALKLLRNPEERQRLAAHARRSARQRFSLEQMVNATEQIYLGAITEGMKKEE